MRSTKASAAVERLRTRSGNPDYSMSVRADGLFVLRLATAEGNAETIGSALPMDAFVTFVNNCGRRRSARASWMRRSGHNCGEKIDHRLVSRGGAPGPGHNATESAQFGRFFSVVHRQFLTPVSPPASPPLFRRFPAAWTVLPPLRMLPGCSLQDQQNQNFRRTAMTTSVPQMATLSVRLEGAVAEISLNRPERSNALNEAMWQELRTAMRWADGTPEIRAVVLAGAGKISAPVSISPCWPAWRRWWRIPIPRAAAKTAPAGA